MKKLRKILIIILSALLVITMGAAIYFFDTALKYQPSPTDEQDAYTYLFEHEYMQQWVDTLRSHHSLRDTFIVAPDGIRLHALYIRGANSTRNTALIIHGYKDNAIRMLMIGYLYNHRLGYNVLLPDLRAHGKSGGEYIQMGWNDRKDMHHWLDVAKGIYGDSTHIAVHGISMGAATAMNMSGDSLPPNVKCFVEDCGYTSVWDEFSHKLKQDYHLPSFPILDATSLYCVLREGWSFQEASSLEQLKKSRRPMFFIHGDADTYVPTWMVHKLYEAKQGEKELWVLPGVAHANAYWDYTEDYIARVDSFVSKYMK